MRRTEALLLAAAVALAGCAGGSTTKQDSSTDDTASPASPDEQERTSTDPETTSSPKQVEDTGPRALKFQGTFQLTITHAFLQPAQNHRFNLDPNCVSFGKDQVWLVFNGTAEVKWSSSNAFASRMTLQIRDVGQVASNGGSASPSTLQFGRFHAAPNAALGLIFVVQPSDVGAVYKQAATMDIAFQYLGKPDLKTQVIPCTYTT